MLARVVGMASPLSDIPVPVTVACERVTELPPLFVIVSERLAFAPTAIDPNERLVGFAPRSPGAIPSPESGRLTLPCAPAVVNVTLPLKLPLFVGAKVRLADVLFPECSVMGSAMLFMVNPAPLRVA